MAYRMRIATGRSRAFCIAVEAHNGGHVGAAVGGLWWNVRGVIRRVGLWVMTLVRCCTRARCGPPRRGAAMSARARHWRVGIFFTRSI